MFVASTRQAILDLYRAGVKQSEIARRLALASTTVSYHVERLDQDEPAPSPVEPEPDRRGYIAGERTRSCVERLLAEGLPHVDIARRLGISKQTVSYHVRQLGRDVDQRCARRYDWAAVQEYYDAGHSVRDCMKAFGFCSASWFSAVKRGALNPRPSATPMSELLVAGKYRGRFNLKVRLVKEGLKENCCERCGINEWLGEALSLALHHINGDRLDNRLENLELLCPNCHSRTDTYSGRNGHRRVRPETGLTAEEGDEGTRAA